MMDAQELKPCPFCGGKSVVIFSWSRPTICSPSCANGDCPGYNMEQDEQGGFAAEYGTKAAAIEAWNTRTSAHPVTVEMLKRWANICEIYEASRTAIEIRAAIEQMENAK